MPPPHRPDRFEDAIAWFRKKKLIRKPAFEKLTAKAKAASFTVAGVAQMDLMQEVWEAVDKAIASGETMAAFRKRVLPALKKSWGGKEIPGRLNTIFRTNVQASYSAGRVNQLLTPEVRRIMTFWKFSAIRDDRTTKHICLPIAGTILPAGHPWFRKRTPPLHYQCRSAILGLRASDVKDQGGATKKPKLAKPQPGFGEIEPIGKWKPDLKRYAKPLVKKYRRGK